MLIRNVNSLFELENLKKQQATILQLQIDNEKIKEQRVADFKNPNKPPPIPEQYKTASEIQADAMAQQKITIDHLKSLGLDNFLATQVSNDMKNSLAEGDGAYVKFNSYFPAFKKKIETGRILKTLINSEQIIELIKIFFNEIDESNGLSITGTTSTNYFNNDTNITDMLFPSSQLMGEIVGQLELGRDRYRENILDSSDMINNLIDMTKNFRDILPEELEIKHVEALPNIEKSSINKNINYLFTKYNFPTARKLFIALDLLSRNSGLPENLGDIDEDERALREELLQEVNRGGDRQMMHIYFIFVSTLNKLFSGYDTKTEKKLNEVIQQIKSSALGIANTARNLVNNEENQLSYIRNQIKVASQDYLARNINFFSINDEDIFPEEEGYDENALFEDGFLLYPPTIDGNQPNNSKDEDDNVIYENYNVNNNKKKFRGMGFLRNGQQIKIRENGYYYLRGFDGDDLEWKEELYVNEFNEGLLLAEGDEELQESSVNNYLYVVNRPDTQPKFRYTKAELGHLIERHELPNLRIKLDRDPHYQPANDGGSRIYPQLNQDGQPQMMGNTQGWGLKPKPKRKNKKSKKDSSSESSSDGETEKKMRDIHIDINSHNGKDYKMSGDGFIKRRIKIGKGLEVRNDEPKFRQFGKYIIHMPQLRNNNIFNLKHKSGGSIPSIKPVHIEDNYKDFVIDVLDSGRVNDRHYKSLTEPEQNHFLKAVRGAGIIHDLKLKATNQDKEQEEIKRLELLLGEVNAGNDNASIIKEARILIKKYVSNGRISRQKGLDMLLELE